MVSLRGSAGCENPSSGYTLVSLFSLCASYSDWTAASRNILLQLASRKRSEGWVVR